jgi:streptogramin lyase
MASRILVALCTAAVASPVAASPAAADLALDGQFPVSALGANNQITTGPDGNIWVTLESGKDVARITPGGVVDEFDAPTINGAVGITAGPDGNLWVTHNGGVARFSPSDPNGASAFAIAEIADPRAITVGPDGNLWTASGGQVIRIPPGNPAAKEAFGATGVISARWIASGGGYLWVADFGGDAIVRIAPDGTGTFAESAQGTQGVAATPDGQVAYTMPAPPQAFGILQPPISQTIGIPDTDPFGVTFGPDGAFWVAQFATDDLGRFTPAGQYATLPLGPGTGPRHLTAGPGGTLWVTLDSAEKVARISGVAAPTGPLDPGTGLPAPVSTKITKKPKKVIRTKKKRAKVRMKFTGTPGAKFQCQVKKTKWRKCKSPKTYRLKKGRYVIRVRAVLDGTRDSTPAKVRFRVVRKR